MKISLFFQNNNSSNTQRQNVSFRAGLTREIAEQINRTSIADISKKLEHESGIPSDFQGNPVVAWGSAKAVEIFQQLNKRFGLKLALPKGTYLKDFERLHVDDPNATGYCNLFPTRKLKKDSDELVQEGVIFFNSYETMRKKNPLLYQLLFNWNKINTIADNNFSSKHSGTNHFLDPFIHELSHAAYLERLQKKIGRKNLETRIRTIKSAEKVRKCQEKYGERISQICEYALSNPLEAIACDMSKLITGCLDEKTLMPTKNPFVGTPYERLSLWQRTGIPYYTDEQRPLPEILRNFWNGNFN